MRILSLGAGVQSSTLLLMAVAGEITLDGAIFVDTQWEPGPVYRHLAWLESVSNVPIYRVTEGNLREDSLTKRGMFACMPLHTEKNGQKSMLRRTCTDNYKLRPIRAKLRELGASRREPGVLVLGISVDEAHRMRDAGRLYLRHEYPLVDRRMSRQDCRRWLVNHGYPVPPKSSCIGCPYRGNDGWRDIASRPEEWADAVAFDHAVRELPRLSGKVFLHRSLQPLELVDLRTARDLGQMDLFGEECEGVCGV